MDLRCTTSEPCLRWLTRRTGGTWEASAPTLAPSLNKKWNPLSRRLLNCISHRTRVHEQEVIKTKHLGNSKDVSDLCHHKHSATTSLSLFCKLCFCRKAQHSGCLLGTYELAGITLAFLIFTVLFDSKVTWSLFSLVFQMRNHSTWMLSWESSLRFAEPRATHFTMLSNRLLAFGPIHY